MNSPYWERRREQDMSIIDECDGCGKITNVEVNGKLKYCKKCKDEVERGN